MVIVGGSMEDDVMSGDHSQLPQLYATDWFDTEDAARAAAMPVYFQIYAHREGFKHPEDPTLSPLDLVGNATVFTIRDGDPMPPDVAKPR